MDKQGVPDDIKQEMLKHTGFSQDQIVDHYDEVAEKYDDIYLSAGYYDHIKCCELAAKLVPQDKRAGYTVFDMGCGTGLVGEEMQKIGFDSISGCDASPGILKQAAKKNDGKAYIETIELFLGTPEKFPDNLKGKFDMVTAAGILAQGHLDTKVFEEMLMSCKGKGSYIIFTTRDMYLTEYGYQKKIDELIEAGKWKQAEVVEFFRYDKLGDEEVGRYKKVVVKCFAFEVL